MMDPIAVPWEPRPGVPAAITVSQLARLIRETVRTNPLLSRILVRGEVSNFQTASAGHVFFTLKDATAQVSCTLFREDAEFLGFDLEDGMDVVVSGDVDVFPRKGTVQLLVRAATPAGVGAFWAAYQRTRKKLAAEGLFDSARKRPLPSFPRRIGVVTSESGAVVHDIVTIRRAARERARGLGERMSRRGLRRSVETNREQRERLHEALSAIGSREILRHRENLAAVGRRLDLLSPLATLQRGYAIAEREDGHIVARATEVEEGDALAVRFQDGRIHVHVKGGGQAV